MGPTDCDCCKVLFSLLVLLLGAGIAAGGTTANDGEFAALLFPGMVRGPGGRIGEDPVRSFVAVKVLLLLF